MRQDLGAIIEELEPMRNSTLRNYIVPGLTSHLIGGAEFGKVRLFHAERGTREFVTPHSHRFNFTCLVLDGVVVNEIFAEQIGNIGNAQTWCKSTINQVCGAGGILDYVHTREDKPTYFSSTYTTYGSGDTYRMSYTQIHSIRFERNSKVLFFEGPQLVTQSEMIEPWINGKCVPTFRTAPWMFERS